MHFLWLLLGFCHCFTKSGPENRFYSIPFYYGSRTKDWNNTLSFYDDLPVLFFWSHNWNVDFKGNLWVVDKDKHTVYYISKELMTFNAIFKVTGLEGSPGMLNGNIAMSLFNSPMSVYVWDNNPNYRKERDNMLPIELHQKFFEPDMSAETKSLKD